MSRNRLSWVYVVVSMTVATVSLFALPGYADGVEADLGLSSAQVGLLTTAMTLPYALAQVPAGVFVNVYGVGRLFAVAFGLLAVGYLLTAVTGTLAVLVVARVVAGFGAGMLLPLGSTLARTVAPEQNLRAQGVLGSGWGLGYLVALFALPLLVDSWRSSFAVVAGSALVLGAVAPWLGAGVRATDPRLVVAETLAALRPRRVWRCAACLLGMTFVNVGLGSWVTSYLDDRGSISSTQARWLPALIGLGLLPAALVGALAARGGRERRVVGASALGLAAVAVLLGVAASPVLIGVLLFALGWFSALPFGVILASVVGAGGAARAETQGVLTGAVNGLGFLAGSAAPPLVGAVKDASGSYVVAFSVLAVGAVVSLAATRGAFPSNRVAAAVPQHG